MSESPNRPASPKALPTLEEWVLALRSGEFAQAKGVLHAENGALCCLGVYCVLAGVENEKLGLMTSIVDDPQRKGLAEKRNLVPGFAKLVNPDWQLDLAVMNDGGKSFSEIADRIEKELIR